MSAKKYTGYYTYRVWLAYLNHFTKEKFDVRKYPAAMCKRTTYEDSKLRWSFEAFSDMFDAGRMPSVILANLVQGYWGVEENTPFFMLDKERTSRAWKKWGQRMRHFQNHVLQYDGYECIMEGTGSADERFDLFRQQKLSPEGFLISMRGTKDLSQLTANYGETDSFPNHYGVLLFLRKYDLLLEQIPPVADFLNQKGV